MDLPEPLDKETFVRLKAGDHHAFKFVYDAYFGLVQFVVKQCGITGEVALDIVHDTFLGLYKKANTINEPHAVKAWLITAAKNNTVDTLRKRKVASNYSRQRLQENHTDPGNRVNAEEAAENGVIAKSELHELEIYLLGKLVDETQRETSDDTFVLYYREGLSAKEIAERNGEPVSTVTNRLSRLRNRYREKIIAQLTNLRESSF
jgi:RNA polymerase sigma factor (sigma-70 family)